LLSIRDLVIKLYTKICTGHPLTVIFSLTTMTKDGVLIKIMRSESLEDDIIENCQKYLLDNVIIEKDEILLPSFVKDILLEQRSIKRESNRKNKSLSKVDDKSKFISH
jgi:hypothetical protein